VRPITRIYVHCSATKPGMYIGAEEIRRWHMEGNGWSRIGYHRIIRRSGEIEFGLPLNKKGIHVRGDNANTLAICMVGGIDEHGKPDNNFTEEQWESLAITKQYFDRMFPEAEWLGHRDHPKANKACPSFDVAEWAASQAFSTGGGF